MIRTLTQIEIAKPPKEVFAFLVDPSKSLLWQSTLVEIQGEPGLPAGSSGHFVSHVLGQRVTSRFTIIENDGYSYYYAKSSQGPLAFHTRVQVQPAQQASTVIYETTIDAGHVYRLAETALESIAKTRFQADLETLKVVLEEGGQSFRSFS
jgi:carbon monoxide dehydrogenase subunit G